MPDPVDEFAWIASLRGLTRSDPRALGLVDDAAVLPARAGYDLVISKDAMVEGVHFLEGEAPDIIARRLLRTSLSDLAAKAAEPFGYFLLTAFPAACGAQWRSDFVRGLDEDGKTFGVALLGGDTVSTIGPLVVSATVLGWAPHGGAVLRSGARVGDAVMVCGAIGDGWLGLQAARGSLVDPGGVLASHFLLPIPLLSLRAALAECARAAADVSDGLLADVEHVANASRLGVTVDLAKLPLSDAGRAWLGRQNDPESARLTLAAGGDDYAIVCAVAPSEIERFRAKVESLGIISARVGVFDREPGLRLADCSATPTPLRTGWRH